MSNFDKTYYVIGAFKLEDEMIDQSLNSETSFRLSLDCSKAILNFGTKFPYSMAGKDIIGKYNHAGIIQYLKDNDIEWNEGIS